MGRLINHSLENQSERKSISACTRHWALKLTVWIPLLLTKKRNLRPSYSQTLQNQTSKDLLFFLFWPQMVSDSSTFVGLLWCACWDAFQLSTVVKSDHLSYYSLPDSLSADRSGHSPLMCHQWGVSACRPSAHTLFPPPASWLNSQNKSAVSEILKKSTSDTNDHAIYDVNINWSS